MAQYETTLRGYLSKYKHPNETFQDIISTLTQFTDLRAALSPFVFSDGTEKQLVQLEGTIPVNFKGNIYNIPILLSVMETHPYNPPMVFVKPTNTMQTNPGRYVDAHGKVDMPFIREWSHPTSDLLSLVQILIFIFEEECPVIPIAPGQRPQPMPNPGPGYPLPAGCPYPQAGNYSNVSNPLYPSYPPQNTEYPPPYPPNTSALAYPSTQPQRAPNYTGAGLSYPPSQFNSNPSYPAGNSIGAGERPTITPTGTVTEADLRASTLSADSMRWRLEEILKQAQYKHPNEAKQDIIGTLAQYKDLRPSLSPFVFSDGTKRQLVQLEGTIPVNFKG